MTLSSNRPKNMSRMGFASVEFTILLPVFLLLLAGIVEFTQMIQANHIILSMSREGANLMSRNQGETPQQVMTVIASTSNPLDISSDGIIYVNKVMGQTNPSTNNVENVLVEQHRWTSYGFNRNSSIWDSCSNWAVDGSCTLPASNPVLTGLPVTLSAGEFAYIVEVSYSYTPILGYFITENLTLDETTFM